MKARRRFYKTVTVTGDNAIALDGKPIKTPMKAALRLPARVLAEAVAAEWEAQGAEINPASMPLTRLANTAIDRVARIPFLEEREVRSIWDAFLSNEGTMHWSRPMSLVVLGACID